MQGFDIKLLGHCKEFLEEHNPFDYIDNLRNIMTVLIGTEEINSHDAIKIGIQAMQATNGKYYNESECLEKLSNFTV